MTTAYSVDELLEFLEHAGDRGLLPAATAQALAVASRNVLAVLGEQERSNLGLQDIDSVVKRFNNKRAKDFNPSSLKEYGRRVRRAIELFLRWREDPANFTVRTRATSGVRRRERIQEASEESEGIQSQAAPVTQVTRGTYQSSVPIRSGLVVTLLNIPHDLTKSEAERIASFVRMLAVDA